MRIFKILSVGAAALVLATATLSAQENNKPAQTEEQIMEHNKKTYQRKDTPDQHMMEMMKGFIPTRPKENYVPNTMLDQMSAQAKMAFMQTIMATMPFSLRDMINMMVAKKKVLPGISFDEVIESIQSKALDLNMRPTGHNTPYVVLRESFDPESPRVEFLSFCDLITMRKILDYTLELSAFLPCRIAVLEDANKQIWITTLDFDVRWLDTSPNPNKIDADLRERAIRVRKNIEEIMEAGATGDF